MPEQAILDLPVIEFEQYEDSIGGLHARCIESYGLAGFRPHPDAVFHLGASLWRYRDGESLKQVAALATCYLQALSRQVASRRRVAAVRATLDEPGSSDMRNRLVQADDELAQAQDELNDISLQVRAFVASFTSLGRRNPAGSDERLRRNLSAMGEPGWLERLELLGRELAKLDGVRIDWSAPLTEVLEDLAGLPTSPPGNGNGHGKPGSTLERLQRELDEYRVLANRASTRLRQVDDERHQLESLLHDTEQQSTSRSMALEEAREALEVTLVEARERLERLEKSRNAELLEARREILELRAERDRLADELLHSLDSATEFEVSQEELIERLENAASDRSEAAEALSSLSRRLEEVQNDAVSAGDRIDALNSRVLELEDLLEEVGNELSHSEERRRQAEATITALEGDVGLSSEFEAILTESEERLADTQERLADADTRVDQLGGQLEDKDYELQRAADRLAAQKQTIDSISVQLAEAESLADAHDARIVTLERENERLRRDLSDSQSKMLDARGDVDEAREAAREATAELARQKELLEQERNRTTSISSESFELRKLMRDRDEEVTHLQAELDDTAQRLLKSEKNAEETAARLRDLQDELEASEQARQSAEEANTELQADLKTATNAAAEQSSASASLTEEGRSLRSELEKARAEYTALQESVSRNGNQGAELRASVVVLEQEIAAMRIEQEAAAALSEDRRQKLEERLELAKTRADNAELERATLQEALDMAEKHRADERRELEALVERERKRLNSDEGALQKSSTELEALRVKLNESEAFVIKRQREFEKTDGQLKSLLEEVRGIADLRTKYEKAKPGKKRDEIASQIGRRMDSLFSSAGRPVHADRRTEKLVILTVKKTDKELAEEGNKPFVATNKGSDKSNADDEEEAES